MKKAWILFDTVEWENAFEKEPERVARVLSGLVHRMGGNFKFSQEKIYDHYPVSIAKYANMQYLDRVAGDGKGGWLDAGRYDMRFFLINHAGTGSGELDDMAVSTAKFPEKVKFLNVDFSLLSPEVTKGKSIMAFGSELKPAIAMRETGPISIGRKADILHILHASGWGKYGESVAEYNVAYSDGTKTSFHVVNGVHVTDWFYVKPGSQCKVAWLGKNLEINSCGFVMYDWKNPHPEKEIASVSIRAGLGNAQYVVVAMTASVQRRTEKNVLASEKGKTLIHLDFSKENPLLIGSGTLRYSIKKKESDRNGLVLKHGDYFRYTLEKKEKELLTGKPFGISITFTPTEKPSGYYGGLFHSAEFRICLQQHSRGVWIETPDPLRPGKRMTFQSSLRTELNKTYSVEARWNGKNIIFFWNGELQYVKPAQLPSFPFFSFSVGMTGGKNYFFNGKIHKVEVFELE